MKTAFIDLEIDGKGRILDIGGVKNGLSFHSARIPEFAGFVSDCGCLCGHNIIGHDIKYLKPFLRKEYPCRYPLSLAAAFPAEALP